MFYSSTSCRHYLTEYLLIFLSLRRGDRAVGVEYISHAPDAEDKEAVVAVYASRLVVLSSGAFGSPAILER